jgi:hypothetical protein
MTSYSKGKYLKLELSHYEFQMLHAIIMEARHDEQDFFTLNNLQDLKSLMDDNAKKVN